MARKKLKKTKKTARAARSKRTVAFGKAKGGAFLGEHNAAHDAVSAGLREACRTKHAKAVAFIVDVKNASAVFATTRQSELPGLLSALRDFVKALPESAFEAPVEPETAPSADADADAPNTEAEPATAPVTAAPTPATTPAPAPVPAPPVAQA